MRRAMLSLVAAGLLGVACSSGSESGADLEVGSFGVTVAPFSVQAAGTCTVTPFTLTVDRDQADQLQVTVPQVSYTCQAGGPFDLQLITFATVPDSLELGWRDTLSAAQRLTLRWHPGSRNLAGSAILDLEDIGADTTTWSAARQ